MSEAVPLGVGEGVGEDVGVVVGESVALGVALAEGCTIPLIKIPEGQVKAVDGVPYAVLTVHVSVDSTPCNIARSEKVPKCCVAGVVKVRVLKVVEGVERTIAYAVKSTNRGMTRLQPAALTLNVL